MNNPWAIHGMIRNGHCVSGKQRGYLIQKLKAEGIYSGGSYSSRPSVHVSPEPDPLPFIKRKPFNVECRLKELQERLEKLSSKGAKRIIEGQIRDLQKRRDL